MFVRKFVLSSFTFVRNVRNFRSGKPSNSSLLDADESKSLTKFYHLSGFVLAVLTPAAFIISPSPFNMPIDIALGLIFPFHSHIALNYVISDYVPKALRTAARGTLLGVTVVTVAGLLRLNLQGVGLTETIKSLWRKKKHVASK